VKSESANKLHSKGYDNFRLFFDFKKSIKSYDRNYCDHDLSQVRLAGHERHRVPSIIVKSILLDVTPLARLVASC
jgi:hypothetical protein